MESIAKINGNVIFVLIVSIHFGMRRTETGYK